MQEWEYTRRNEPGQGLITGAFVCGILSIVTAVMMTVYLPYIFGGISIILAVLSKGKGRILKNQAKIGVLLAIIGLVFNTALVGSSVYIVFNDQTARDELNEKTEQLYGESFDDMLEAIENGAEMEEF